MKKNQKSRGILSWRLNYDLKMKLSLILFLTMSFLMQANTTYAQKTKISMDKEDVMLKEIIDYIEANTEFKFLFTSKTVDLNKKVSLNVKKASINSIIESLFDISKISYEIDDRKVLLKTKEITNDSIASKSIKTIEKPQTAVTGTVTDPAGMPMLGVHIPVKGTN